MGILLDLLSNSKSQFKYLYSLSNLRSIRRISSPAAVDHDPAGLSRKAPQLHAPAFVGDLKSNNKSNMLLIEHFHNESGIYKPEHPWNPRVRYAPYNYSLISYAADNNDHQNVRNNPFSGLGKYELAGSCNELILLFFSDSNGDRIALWNPTINKIKTLPLPARRPVVASTSTMAHGFGFDPESEDYKVLRFTLFWYKDDCEDFYFSAPHIQLYSLKTNSWKEITNTHYNEPFHEHSIHVNGVYYWVELDFTPDCTYKKVYHSIRTFDFANEKFSYIPLPPLLANDFVPVEFDGSFAALVHSELGNTEEPFSFEVWGWNGESWIERMPITTIHVPGSVYKVLGLFQDDNLFLQAFYKNELVVFVFDLAKNKLKNLGIHADPCHVEIFPYVSMKQIIN